MTDEIKLELTFKSGAQVVVDADEGKHTRNPVSGNKILEWKTPTGAKRRLVSCELDEVVCVVEIR